MKRTVPLASRTPSRRVFQPCVALLACATVVWQSKMNLVWRVGGLVLTVLGMLLQCGI